MIEVALDLSEDDLPAFSRDGFLIRERIISRSTS